MVFKIENKQVTLLRGDDSYEIFKELKQFLKYNPQLYTLKRIANLPQDDPIDLGDVVLLQRLLPYAERVSKDISDWITYHINRQTGKSIYRNENYYGGNYGNTFIPVRNRKIKAPNEQHVIKLNRGQNKVVFPSGWFFTVYQWLKDNYRHTLRSNQVIDGVTYPICIDLQMTNQLQYKSDRVYTCGKGHLQDRQVPAMDHVMDLLTGPSGRFRNYMLWNLHIGYGKTYFAGSFIDNVINPKVIFPIASKSLMLKSIPDYAGPMGYKVSVICADYMKADIERMMNSPLLEDEDGFIYRISPIHLREDEIELGVEVTLKRKQTDIIPLNNKGIPVTILKGHKFTVTQLPFGMENVTFDEFTDFTFVMVPTYIQQLGKKFTGTELKDFNICIVDECNEHLSNQCVQLYDMLDVGMTIGMSGTPYGSPDQEKHVLCTNIFGKEVVSENLHTGITKKAVLGFDIEVYTNTNASVDPEVKYPNIDTHVYLSKDRLAELKKCLNNHPDESVFIYTGHADLEYGYLLEDFLQESKINCKFINGSVKNKEYLSTLEQFKTGYLPTLISNRVLTSGENLNICSLIVMWYTGMNDLYIIQSIGRILRLFEGQDRAVIALFRDQNAGKYTMNFEYQLQAYLKQYPDARVIYC